MRSCMRFHGGRETNDVSLQKENLIASLADGLFFLLGLDGGITLLFFIFSWLNV
ncbi:hypothetical protein Scep_019191 [Stephania cephalantha]|uniref:Uncharacterized protein n=1 Tax=Stephania cephalantha TaxID=152367 RepID=A0AAP0IAK7_9MAGN